MAEKRQREETPEMEGEKISKRCKPYDHILSILEEDEEEEEETNTAQEVEAEMGSIFTTLQQEISFSSSSSSAREVEAEPHPTPSSNQEDDNRFAAVIRHLLEASDDELGIPNHGGDNTGDTRDNADGQDFPFSLCDGWWEFEDESANYYS